MGNYFTGKQIHSIDAKGRIIIPAKFREKLGNEFVVLCLHNCLNLYPSAEWDKLLEKISNELPATDRSYLDVLSYNSEPVEMDKQGRVILPPEMREAVKIEKDIVSVGSFEKIHVYAKNVWEKVSADVSSSNIEDKFAQYGIRL